LDQQIHKYNRLYNIRYWKKVMIQIIENWVEIPDSKYGVSRHLLYITSCSGLDWSGQTAAIKTPPRRPTVDWYCGSRYNKCYAMLIWQIGTNVQCRFTWSVSFLHKIRFQIDMKWIVPQIFKLLPKWHIFFDLVIRFITNRKYAFLCIF